MSARVKVGDWVLVYGQVTAEVGEDLVVEFFSHNQQWEAPVERLRVVSAHPPHDLARQCPAITDHDGDLLVRCDGHDRHGEPHGHHLSGITWTDEATVGFFEDAS